MGSFLLLRIYYEKNTRQTLRHLPLLPSNPPEENVAGSAEDPSGFGSVADRGQLLTPPLGSHRPALSTAPQAPHLPLSIGYFPFSGLLTHLLFWTMNSLYLLFWGQGKVRCWTCCRASWSGGFWKPVHLTLILKRAVGAPGHLQGPTPQSRLLPKETCSVPRAFAPTLPDTPVTSGPWYLGTATELGRVGGLFLNKVPAQSWGFFKFKKKESYSVLHLFTVQYIFLTFPVIFEMKPSCVLS